jgi:hypothetical protein
MRQRGLLHPVPALELLPIASWRGRDVKEPAPLSQTVVRQPEPLRKATEGLGPHKLVELLAREDASLARLLEPRLREDLARGLRQTRLCQAAHTSRHAWCCSQLGPESPVDTVDPDTKP